MGYARAGSNPAGVAIEYDFFFFSLSLSLSHGFSPNGPNLREQAGNLLGSLLQVDMVLT